MDMSTRTKSPVLQTTFTESNGSLSPDGRYLAYQSDQSGEMQIYVRSLTGGPAQVWPVSSGGGSRPCGLETANCSTWMEAAPDRGQGRD